jgi:hypothetical protein
MEILSGATSSSASFLGGAMNASAYALKRVIFLFLRDSALLKHAGIRTKSVVVRGEAEFAIMTQDSYGAWDTLVIGLRRMWDYPLHETLPDIVEQVIALHKERDSE